MLHMRQKKLPYPPQPLFQYRPPHRHFLPTAAIVDQELLLHSHASCKTPKFIVHFCSDSSTVRETHLSSSEYPSPSADAIHFTSNCVSRIKELQAEEASRNLLRLSIEAGGCSGFQYNFLLDDKTNDDDRIFEKDGVKLVVDNISFDFVKGANVDYVEELIRSAFQVSTNPSAVGGCSSKSSFMVK